MCVGMEWRGLERGRGVAVVVVERVGRRWKRGRPFPRAARSFHQPPQLAGSAAAPPALPELTLFPPDPNLKSVSSLGQNRETTYKIGHF